MFSPSSPSPIPIHPHPHPHTPYPGNRFKGRGVTSLPPNTPALTPPQRHSHTPTPAPTAFPTASNRPPTALRPLRPLCDSSGISPIAPLPFKQSPAHTPYPFLSPCPFLPIRIPMRMPIPIPPSPIPHPHATPLYATPAIASPGQGAGKTSLRRGWRHVCVTCTAVISGARDSHPRRKAETQSQSQSQSPIHHL